MKCDNPVCCDPMRSDLKRVLPDGFLPPPLRVRHDPETSLLVLSKPQDTSPSCHFLPLFQRLSLQVKVPWKGTVPYDFHCPSVQGDLKKRVCSECGIYLASTTRLNDLHKRDVHPTRRQTQAALRRVHECEVGLITLFFKFR